MLIGVVWNLIQTKNSGRVYNSNYDFTYNGETQNSFGTLLN